MVQLRGPPSSYPALQAPKLEKAFIGLESLLCHTRHHQYCALYPGGNSASFSTLRVKSFHDSSLNSTSHLYHGCIASRTPISFESIVNTSPKADPRISPQRSIDFRLTKSFDTPHATRRHTRPSGWVLLLLRGFQSGPGSYFAMKDTVKEAWNSHSCAMNTVINPPTSLDC